MYPLLPTGSLREVIETLNHALAAMAVANGVLIVMSPDPLSVHSSDGTLSS
jgi:hypothetical protein